MKTYIKEIGLFLKKYLVSIIIGTIVIALAFSAFIFFQNRSEIEKTMGPESSETTIEPTEITPTFFRFYMKLPDGYSFMNGPLMDEILNSPMTYELLNESVSFDITEYLVEPSEDEETEEEAPAADEEERFRMVDVNVDPNSNVFTLVVELGNPDRNMEVIDYYYNALVNEELEVLEANEVYVLNEPTFLSESRFDPEFFDDISESYVKPSLIDAWDIIIAVTFALFIMLIVSILREVFNRTLNYSFAYTTGDSYESLLFDKEVHDPELVRYFVGSPKHTNKLVLSEKPLNQEMVHLLEADNELTLQTNQPNQIFVKNLTTLSEFNLTDNIQEIIIFVYSHETSRAWYKEEIEYSRVLKLPVKTIHFM